MFLNIEIANINCTYLAKNNFKSYNHRQTI